MAAVKVLLSVDIGGTAIKAGIVDAEGKVLYKHVAPSNINGYETPLIEVAKDAASVAYEYARDRGWDIKGIGVSAAGQINSKTGQVIGACGNIPNWIGVNIKREFKDKFKLKTHVENDANCAALAEKWIGAGRKFNDFIAYTIGTGIGGGIIKDGRLMTGSQGIGGEIGHMIIEANGKECTCGNKGCWEQYASMTALVRSVKMKLQESEITSPIHNIIDGDLNKLNGKVIFEAAEMGDQLSLECIKEFVKYNAIGIVSLLHILNPEAVIIGGGVSMQKDSLVEPIKKEVFKRTMPAFVSEVEIMAAQLGNDAGMVGAVKAFMDKYGMDMK